MNKQSAKSKNRPTDTQLSSAVLFLTALVIFAIASIGALTTEMAGAFLGSVSSIILTILAVLAVTVIYAEY